MKVLDFSGWNFNWQVLANNPFRTTAASNSEPFACIVNGYPSLLYPCQTGNPGVSQGALLVSFDNEGNVCTYRTPDYVNGIANKWQQVYYSNCAQSGNTFTWSLLNQPTNYRWVIPNVFAPGINFVVPYSALNIPPPCGAGLFHQTIFLPKQSLVAYEFIEAFGASDNYYASIYTTLNELVGAGFIGNGPNDIFDQANLIFPPNTFSTDLYSRNQGNFIGNNNQRNYAWLTPYLNGDPQSLICATPTPSVYVGAFANESIISAELTGVPIMNFASDAFAAGDTDQTGFFLFPNNPVSIFMSADWCLMMPIFNATNTNLWYSAAMKKWLKHDNSNINNQNGGTFYVGTGPDLSAYGPPPSMTRSVHNGLANYHRAVSTRGTFQA